MMKKLHFKDTFKNFLYDLNEFITIYENHFHVFNYKKLKKLSEKEIVLSLERMELIIVGESLKISQMSRQELLIIGTIKKVEFNYV